MSLDVNLIDPIESKDICYHCNNEYKYNKTIYTDNITHNLGQMAKEANIYTVLWRPEELGYIKAEQIIKSLELGLKDLKNRPEYFKQFNSSNGWGMYENFVPFVEKYLNACKENPNALVKADR